jgi:hypothetical protein
LGNQYRIALIRYWMYLMIGGITTRSGFDVLRYQLKFGARQAFPDITQLAPTSLGSI